MVGIDRTEAYATGVSYLDILVQDNDLNPVDGALVTVYGTWAVYGEPDLWAPATEVLTGLDGRAHVTVGEYNPYGWSAVSAIGMFPEEGYLRRAVTMSDPGETYSIPIWIPAVMPEPLDVDEEDLAGDDEPEVSLSFEFAVESHRTLADGRHFGTFTWAEEGGTVDALLVDAHNYDRYLEARSIDAEHVALAATEGEAILDLPRSEEWILVLANNAFVASTMVGHVAVSVAPFGEVEWTEPVEPIDYRFRIAPGEHVAITLEP